MKGWSRVFLVVFCVFFSKVYATDNNSTKGNDFWLAFMKNYITSKSLIVSISAYKTTDVKVEIPGWSVNLSMIAGETKEVNIPVNFITVLSETIDQKAVHITSTDSVSVYAFNEEYATSDGSLILPTHVLKDKYCVLGFESSFNNGFVIVGTENQTTINITPSVKTAGGHDANKKFQITLNQGDTYYVYSSEGDLTGTVVESKNCKSFAVFAGNECANVGCGGCDHLYEQLLPISNLGKSYVAIPFSGLKYSLRILSVYHNTTITYRGKTAVMDSLTSITLNDLADATTIQSNNPIEVAEFMQGDCTGPNGDPMMVFLAPATAAMNSVCFSTMTLNQGTDLHYLNLLFKTSDFFNIQLDGLSISQFTIQPSDMPDYSFVQMPISAGKHNVTSLKGVTGSIYGVNFRESYGYSLGGNFDTQQETRFEKIIFPDFDFCASQGTKSIDLTKYNKAPMKVYTDSTFKKPYNGSLNNFTVNSDEPGSYNYYFICDAGGCSTSKGQFSINLHKADSLIIGNQPKIKVNDPPLTLNIVSPSGGEYIGEALENNILNPEKAALGEEVLYYQYKNKYGCESYTRLVINIDDCCQGIKNSNLDFRISPNPGSGNFHICYNAELAYLIQMFNSELNVFDQTGKVVHHQFKAAQLFNDEPLDLTTLASGIYLVEVNVNGQSYSKKIMIQ